MSRDGRGQVMLTDGPSNNQSPTWSAESRKLVFASDRDGDWEIYLLDLATRAVMRLTDNTWDDTQPDWSKISGRIAFVSTQFSLNGELFTMAADGSDVQQLTSNVNGDSRAELVAAGEPSGVLRHAACRSGAVHRAQRWQRCAAIGAAVAAPGLPCLGFRR